jgi:hypothetical protein
MALTACGNSNSGGGTITPVPGAGGVAGMSISSCQVGQVYTTTYGCLNQYNCQSGYGYSSSAGCVPGTVVTTNLIYGGSAASSFGGTLQITNSDQYKKLLQYSGMCNPYWVGWNWGSYSCDSWTNGAALVIDSFSSTGMVNMAIRAGGNWSTGYGAQQLSQTATAQPYNNNAGVAIIGVNYNNQDVGLRVISTNGTLSSSSLSVTLYYQQVPFATATLQRY